MHLCTEKCRLMRGCVQCWVLPVCLSSDTEASPPLPLTLHLIIIMAIVIVIFVDNRYPLWSVRQFLGMNSLWFLFHYLVPPLSLSFGCIWFDFEIFYSDIKAEMVWTRDKYCPCKVLSRNCVIADWKNTKEHTSKTTWLQKKSHIAKGSITYAVEPTHSWARNMLIACGRIRWSFIINTTISWCYEQSTRSTWNRIGLSWRLPLQQSFLHQTRSYPAIITAIW